MNNIASQLYTIICNVLGLKPVMFACVGNTMHTFTKDTSKGREYSCGEGEGCGCGDGCNC